jgi:hypothetical protein
MFGQNLSRVLLNRLLWEATHAFYLDLYARVNFQENAYGTLTNYVK